MTQELLPLRNTCHVCGKADVIEHDEEITYTHCPDLCWGMWTDEKEK